jgi:anti-sigma B factor antagonist
MDIKEYLQDGIPVLRLGGQVDSVSAPALGDKLDAILGQGHRHLALDLSDVPYISSAGLRVLSIALKTVRAPDAGGDIGLACLSKTVEHAFRISGFNQVFNIYDNVTDAVTALTASKAIDLG